MQQPAEVDKFMGVLYYLHHKLAKVMRHIPRMAVVFLCASGDVEARIIIIRIGFILAVNRLLPITIGG